MPEGNTRGSSSDLEIEALLLFDPKTHQMTYQPVNPENKRKINLILALADNLGDYRPSASSSILRVIKIQYGTNKDPFILSFHDFNRFGRPKTFLNPDYFPNHLPDTT